jgi:hypothetical protein
MATAAATAYGQRPPCGRSRLTTIHHHQYAARESIPPRWLMPAHSPVVWAQLIELPLW